MSDIISPKELSTCVNLPSTFDISPTVKLPDNVISVNEILLKSELSYIETPPILNNSLIRPPDVSSN